MSTPATPHSLEQLVDAAVARTIEKIIPAIDETIGRHTARFDAHHQRLARIVEGGIRRIDQLEDSVAGLKDRIGSAESRMDIIRAVAVAAYDSAVADIVPPPPPELVTACRKPAGAMTTVELDVWGRHVTRTVAGGRDPGVVWHDMCLSVSDHMGKGPADQ